MPDSKPEAAWPSGRVAAGQGLRGLAISKTVSGDFRGLRRLFHSTRRRAGPTRGRLFEPDEFASRAQRNSSQAQRNSNPAQRIPGLAQRNQNRESRFFKWLPRFPQTTPSPHVSPTSNTAAELGKGSCGTCPRRRLCARISDASMEPIVTRISIFPKRMLGIKISS